MLDMLKDSLLKCPVVKKEGYYYFVHPITDGVPQIEAGLLKEIISEIKRVANLKADRIVTAEAMGIPLAASLSLETGLPFNVIRKRSYGLPGEVSVEQSTGYSKSRMFINGIKRGDRVIFVDDVVSTGGTLTAIITALRNIGAEVADIVIVINRSGNLAEIEKKVGMKIKTLVSVDVVKGKVVIK